MDREPSSEELEKLRESLDMEKKKEHYVPRPGWQIAMAWILLAIVILGIINLCYWQMHG